LFAADRAALMFDHMPVSIYELEPWLAEEVTPVYHA
jgi:hypothetical protein